MKNKKRKRTNKKNRTFVYKETKQKLSSFAGMVAEFDYFKQIGGIPFFESLFHKEYKSNAIYRIWQALSLIVFAKYYMARFFSEIEAFAKDPLVKTVLGLKKSMTRQTIVNFLGYLVQDAPERLGDFFLPKFKRYFFNHASGSEAHYLDIDATHKILHGDQDGSGKTHLPEAKGKKSFLMQLAFCAPMKIILAAELRPGNDHCSKDSISFLENLLNKLPLIKGFILRADAGYFSHDMLNFAYLNFKGFIFRLSNYAEVMHEIPHIQNWSPTGKKAKNGEEIEYACSDYRSNKWFGDYKVYVFRHKQYPKENKKPGKLKTKSLIEVPDFSYRYFHIVTTFHKHPIQILEDYNQRGTCETWISELKGQFFAGDTVRQKSFQETHTCFMLAVFAYNFSIWFRLHTFGLYMTKLEQRSFLRKFSMVPSKLVYHNGRYEVYIHEEIMKRYVWRRFLDCEPFRLRIA